MKTMLIAILMCSAISAAAAAEELVSAPTASTAVVAEKGAMLFAGNGDRLGKVYRVAPDGAVQLIFEGKLQTIPATTLTMAKGELTTSLNKSDLSSRR